MRKLLALVGIMNICFAVSAAEDSDVMAGYYGNTWEYIGYDGTKFLHINADTTFEMLHYDNRVFQGIWEIHGKKVCFNIGDDSSCFDDMAGYVQGQEWKGLHHTGNPYTGVIHAGRIPMQERQKQNHK